jgi:hypothetical protein
MGFFTVPTFTFGMPYCFFVVAHDRRRILRFHVTRYPTALWIAQQLRGESNMLARELARPFCQHKEFILAKPQRS